MGEPVTTALLVAAVAGTVDSAVQSRKAAKQQDKANDVAEGEARGADIRAKRKQVREARVRRARLEASANAQGVSGSSGEAGAAGSISTKTDSNLSAIDAGARTRATLNDINKDISRINQRANNSAAVASLAMSAATWNKGRVKPDTVGMNDPLTSPKDLTKPFSLDNQ